MSNSQAIDELVKSLPGPTLCVDHNLVIRGHNGKFAKLYGSASATHIDTSLSKILYIDATVDDSNTLSSHVLSEHLLNLTGAINLSLLNINKDLISVSVQTSKIKIQKLKQYVLIFLEPLTEHSNIQKYLSLNSIINKLDQGIFIAIFNPDDKGRHGQFIEVNDVVCKQLGYNREELLKLNARGINPSGNTETIKAIGRNIKRDGETSFNAIHVGKDGTHNSVQVTAKLITYNNNSYVLSLCNYLSNSQTEADIEQSRFGRLLELSWDEIYVFDIKSLRFSLANNGALDNLGYSKHDINQLKITDLLQDISEATFHRLTQSLFDGDKSQVVLESVFKRKDETTYPVEIRIQLSHSEVPPVYLANVQNISERKETEKNLLFLANHDSLTGLYNRNTFIKKLNESIEHCKRSELLMAVFFLDLDGFKYINDTMGHDVGDKFIIESSRRLIKSVRNTDTVSRLGGDEFTVILTNIKHMDNIIHVANKILTSIAAPITISGHEIKASCSIGITAYPFTDSDNAYTLIKQADTAMYQAKASGKNTFSFYAATLANEAMNLRILEDDLKKAFKKHEFEVYYQSKVTLDNRKIFGAEALLRWPNKKYPNIGPVDFIPIMEKTDLIKKVDLWVLKETCENLKVWLADNPDLVVSINLSAKHFMSNTVVKDIKKIISKSKIPAKNLEIEITEGVLISNAEKAETALNELKDLGFNISLDDFGSGYSSLSYLKQLPIDRLKIDRAFVTDLENNKDSYAIIEAITNLAASLNLSVIAEGIENNHQANILSKLKCNEGQGYLFSKPCPAKHFFAFLKKGT